MFRNDGLLQKKSEKYLFLFFLVKIFSICAKMFFVDVIIHTLNKKLKRYFFYLFFWKSPFHMYQHFQMNLLCLLKRSSLNFLERDPISDELSKKF